MSCWYVWLRALQPPTDIGDDSQGRSVVLFNVTAMKRPSDTFEEEIASLLEIAGVGSRAAKTILVGRRAAMPQSGSFVTVIADPGPAPEIIQNEDGVAYEKPAAQIRVHAAKYVDARTRARAAYSALTAVKNVSVSAA